MDSACEKSRRWQWQPAVALLREILIVKLTPVIITYGVVNSAAGCGAAVTAWRRRWQWQQVVALLSTMVVVKLEPVIITYGTVSSACEKSRRRQWQ